MDVINFVIIDVTIIRPKYLIIYPYPFTLKNIYFHEKSVHLKYANSSHKITKL